MKNYKRILIFGASGSGKNWLGERLSKKLKIKFYDTDDIAWKKKFTIERSWDDKLLMLNKIAIKKSWIIVTGATSYVEEAVKKSDLIIILKSNIFQEGYRIIKRHVKNNLNGKKYTLGPFMKNIYGNYKENHLSSGKVYKYFKKLKKRYPKKVRIFSQREKHAFLENFVISKQ